MMTQKRANFRLEYPPLRRPIFTTDGVAHDILELSEQGMRFALTKKLRFKLGEAIQGTISFRDGKSLRIKGVVLRLLTDHDHCVARLSQGVPYAKMLEEHRILLQLFNN